MEPFSIVFRLHMVSRCINWRTVYRLILLVFCSHRMKRMPLKVAETIHDASGNQRAKTQTISIAICIGIDKLEKRFVL